ncbi:hypothetical protein FO519_009680 [Halicephalobus sp. NKZ332]|nr:hypothetical protein FO519_009680 [Halicephalobus sp. NKZ332]
MKAIVYLFGVLLLANSIVGKVLKPHLNISHPKCVQEDECGRHDCYGELCCDGVLSSCSMRPGCACCGTQVYHFPDGICCDGVVNSCSMRPGCACCGTQVYHIPDGICCDGVVNSCSMRPGCACCGTQVYHIPSAICCDGQIRGCQLGVTCQC